MILSALIALVVACWLGWLIQRPVHSVSRLSKRPAVKTPHESKPAPKLKAQTVAPLEVSIEEGLNIEVFASSQPQQVIFRFPDEESYSTFLSDAEGSRVQVIGRLDVLRALRLKFESTDDLELLLSRANVTRFAALPDVPVPPSDVMGQQRGLIAFGDQTMRWLGAEGDRSRWGAGVRIAVIDSGIQPYVGLPGLVETLDVSPRSGERESDHQHGSAVASLIAGAEARAGGVAPAATLISICVFDENQRADSFAVASGLMAALEHQAQLVNLSMGTLEDNPMIREAVRLVQEQGIVIVASSGNTASAEAFYPAAYPDVISVGAVDARGVLLDFSNHGASLAITAPGCYVGTYNRDGRYIAASGTSMSAPLVTGAIAAVMSNGIGPRLGARKAADLVLQYTDEAGIPGPDSQFGFGILNIGRVMNRNVQGIVDAAITYQEPTPTGVKVTVQNRGTVLLSNLLLEVRTPEETRQFTIGSLPPRAVQTYLVPYTYRAVLPATVTSTVYTGQNGPDLTPDNNTLTWPPP